MLSKFKHRALTVLILIILIIPIASFAENMNYVYDNLNRLKSIEYGNGTMIVYPYDEVGNRLSSITDIDSDVDGMPDAWETNYNLNDAGSDKDGDGLTNLQEYQWGTNPGSC